MNSLSIKQKKFYTLLVTVFIFILWTIVYLLRKTNINDSLYMLLDNIEITCICLGIFFSLVYIEDTFYCLPWIVLLPFSFSHAFDPSTIPTSLIVNIALIFIGILIHLGKYKVEWRKGKLLFGLLAICFSCVFGGLFVETKYSIFQVVIGVGVSIVFIFIYHFFIATKKTDSFESLAFLITCFGIFIFGQEIVYFLSSEDIIHAFTNRGMNLGWALSGNNVGLMFLFSIPFTLYLVIKSKNNFKLIFYEILTLIQIVGIVIAYSRGSILIIGIYSIPLLIIVLINLFKQKKSRGFITIGVILSFLVFCFLALVGIELSGIKIFESLKEIILKGYNFLELNGRIYIYKAYLEKLKSQPIFGYGLLYSMDSVHIEGHPQAFEWAHCTFLQAAFCFGIIGLIAMIYHMIEKYFTCLKKINLEKGTLIAAYLISGTYGLFDVSYFFINYMILLLITFIMSDEYIETIPYKKIFKNKQQ